MSDDKPLKLDFPEAAVQPLLDQLGEALGPDWVFGAVFAHRPQPDGRVPTTFATNTENPDMLTAITLALADETARFLRHDPGRICPVPQRPEHPGGPAMPLTRPKPGTSDIRIQRARDGILAIVWQMPQLERLTVLQQAVAATMRHQADRYGVSELNCLHAFRASVEDMLITGWGVVPLNPGAGDVPPPPPSKPAPFPVEVL